MRYIIKKPIAEGAYDWVEQPQPAPSGDRPKVYERKDADGLVTHVAAGRIGEAVAAFGQAKQLAEGSIKADSPKYNARELSRTVRDYPGWANTSAPRVTQRELALRYLKRPGRKTPGSGGREGEAAARAWTARLAAHNARQYPDKRTEALSLYDRVVAESGLQQLKRANKYSSPQFNWRIGQMNKRDKDSTPLKDKDRAKRDARVAFHKGMRGVKSPTGTPTLEATEKATDKLYKLMATTKKHFGGVTPWAHRDTDSGKRKATTMPWNEKRLVDKYGQDAGKLPSHLASRLKGVRSGTATKPPKRGYTPHQMASPGSEYNYPGAGYR